MMLYHLHWQSRFGNGNVVILFFIMNRNVCFALGWSLHKVAMPHSAGHTLKGLSEILGFRTLSIVLVLKNKLRRNTTFRKLDLFPKSRVSP
jgi:hypothetical protein